MGLFKRGRKLAPTLHRIRKLWKPRYNYFDAYRTEQILRSHCEDDELIHYPHALELLSTNIIQRTYAREQIHNGVRWITWPGIPTSSQQYYQAAVAVPAGNTDTLFSVSGRGELVYFAFSSDYNGWLPILEYDARVELNQSLTNLYTLLQTVMVPRLPVFTTWNPAGPLYAMAMVPRERFSRRFAFKLYNPDVAQHSVGPILIWVQLHQVTAVEDVRQQEVGPP